MKFGNGFKRAAALCTAVLLLAGCILAPPAFAGVFSSQSIETSYCEKGKISIEVRQNEMKVTVPKSSEFSYIIVTFMDSQGNAPQAAKPAKVSEGTVFYQIADRRDGVYYIQLYRNENAEGTFTGVIGGMGIHRCADGGRQRQDYTVSGIRQQCKEVQRPVGVGGRPLLLSQALEKRSEQRSEYRKTGA